MKTVPVRQQCIFHASNYPRQTRKQLRFTVYHCLLDRQEIEFQFVLVWNGGERWTWTGEGADVRKSHQFAPTCFF